MEFEKAEPKSEIKEHLKKCLLCRKSNLDNFEIIKKWKSDFEAKVTEALYIKKENPTLNKQFYYTVHSCPASWMDSFWQFLKKTYLIRSLGVSYKTV